MHLHDENHSKENTEVSSFMQGLKNLLSLGFYFSHNYHLTHTRQRLIKIPNTSSIYEKAEEKFFWNYSLYDEFRDKKIDYIFYTVLICGFVGCIASYINDKVDVKSQIGYNNAHLKELVLNKTTQVSSSFNKVNLFNNKDANLNNKTTNFSGSLNQDNEFTKTELILISRRSVNYAGTRYLTRGIDDDGHVANFVETEQIITHKNMLLSYVQIRGSAPIFFSQLGMTAQTTINRSPEMTSPAFIKHVEEIKELGNYNMLFYINLMNANKPGEQVITSNIEKQIQLNSLKYLRYLFFDFQTETKFENYEKLESFTSSNYLTEILEYFRYYAESKENEDFNNNKKNSKTSIIKEQLGIIRTNCLDCLDRTNVIQTRIAWKIIENQLTYLNYNTEALFGNRFLNNNANNLSHPLMDKFKSLWAEMGDYISIQYAGSASTITSVTKNGKHGIFGLLKHGIASITRFYQGSFEDGFKQKCIELMLQNHKKNNFIIPLNPILEEELNKHQKKFKNYSDLKVYIGSWNVGGASPEELPNLNKWLGNYYDLIDKSNPKYYNSKDNLNNFNNCINSSAINSNSPDIYIIGFQEIVDLNANNVLLYSNEEIAKKWKKLVKNTLEKYGKYSILKSLDLVGLYVIIMVKSSVRENIKYLDCDIVRTGMMGTIGNKGSLIIKFNYNDSTLAFVCSHLSHGLSGNKSRINELHEILNRSFMTSNKELSIKNFDYYFIFGDLNFRIDHKDEDIREMISHNKLSDLNIHDQLHPLLTKGTLFSDMLYEGDKTFDPTYKFTIGTNIYDSAKKRSPAWCDRILINKSTIKDVVIQKYNSVTDYIVSDHKPIYGLFSLKVCKIDFKIRQQLLAEIRNNGKLEGKGTDISCKKYIKN